MKDTTKCIHKGEPKTKSYAPVIEPIYQSSIYVVPPEGAPYPNIPYIRLSNTPNHKTLHAKLASLEGAEASLVVGSGMGAITASVLALVPIGGEVLAQTCLYGGAAYLFRQSFESFGRKVRFFDESKDNDFDSLIGPATKAIYTEGVSNPLLGIPDHAAVVQAAKKHGLISFIDNTVLSPMNFKAAEFGYDVVIHSATKSLNGHSDVLAGAVSAKKSHIDSITFMVIILGNSLDPNSCFLLNRGLKTLPLRARQQNETALAVATALKAHPKIERVNYPGLESHANYKRAKQWFKGAGGLLSFEFRGSVDECNTFLAKLKYPKSAPSLGGVESLITRPVTTSHAAQTKEELKELGIKDTLVRISVGLEAPEDLIDDLLQALD